jgi:hypothetical protein
LDIEDNCFWCTEQLFIYKDIYQKMDKVRPMHPLALDTLGEKDHFVDVVWVTEQMGLHKLMRLQHDYIVPLIQQFYSTLAFKKDEAHTMMWMTGTTPCEANFHRFAKLLGYPFRAGIRLHGPTPPDKDSLSDLYFAHGKVGTITYLLPLYDQLLRFFRDNIAPSGWNRDAIRATLVSLLALAGECAEDEEEKDYTVDVMDYIFHEIHDAIVSRTTIPYAPYIQLLIDRTQLRLRI